MEYILPNQNAFKLKRIIYFTMNKFISIILGLVFLVASILAWDFNFVGFGDAMVSLIKGGILLVVLLIGVVLVFLGMNDLKN